MDCSTAGFPVLHHLSEFAQTHFHWVDGAIQPSHPLSSPFPPAFNLSQHQGFFLMSGLFTLDGQNIGASASVLPVNIQKWFPLELTGFDLLAVTRDSEESSPTLQFKSISSSIFFMLSLLYGPTLMSWLLKKTTVLTRWTFVSQVMSLLLKYTLWVCHSFSSKEQVSFNFTAAVTICSNFGAQENKICHAMMGLDAMIFFFWMLSFKLLFSFTFIKRLFSSSLLSAGGVIRISEVIDISPQSWFQLVLHPAWNFT